MIENTLIRLLGHKRYIRFYTWLHDINPLVGLTVLLIPLAAIWVAAFSPDKHVHDGYINGEVLFTNSVTSENGGFTFTAIVQLPDEKTVTVRTKLMAIANETIKTACLERRKEEDGDLFYYLVGRARCEPMLSK